MPKNSAAFIEAVADDTTGLKWIIRVIRAGKSGNNNFYSDRVLREAVALFDNVRVFVKPDAQHIRGEGKSFQQLIGQLSAPRFIEGQKSDSGEIQATLTLLASAGDVPAKLREAFDMGMSDLFGFSIDADALTQKKGVLREATKFTKVHSVDLIIEPGAGGALVNLIESINSEANADMALRQTMIAAITAANGGTLPAGLNVDDDAALVAAYEKAVATQKMTEAVANAAATAHEGTANADIEKYQQMVRITEARFEARTVIADSGLPDPIKSKLTLYFAEDDALTVEKVREAVKLERETLAKLTDSGHVVGMGLKNAKTTKERADKIVKMFDDFFDRSKHAFSFRECYVEVTGDRGVTGQLQNCDLGKMREALGTEERFAEAISSSTFANILGDSITRAMVREYAAQENYRDWRSLVDIVPVSNFRTQQRTRMGGYGNLPAVAQDAAYNALTSPTDEVSTYAISKRGGKETISMETIANDDVGAIRKVPQKLAVAAARTLWEFVMDFLAANPTIYDSSALFHSVNHANLGVAALDAASFAAARLAMKSQKEKNSLKPLGLILRHVYVPAALEEQAFNLFVRGTNNDETFVQSRKPTVHVVDYWTDTNNWYATADTSETPLIELGFYNGNEEPELFVQDLPTQGSLFTNDQITYKIRHIYGGSVQDYRGFYGAIVA